MTGWTPRRSTANLGATRRLIAARRRRRASYPVIEWRWPLCLALTTVVICLVVLDEPVGAYRGHWPHPIMRIARLTTDIGLGGWYIVPAVLALVALNQVDWSLHRGRRLLALYNWTGLAFYVLVSAGLSGLISTLLKQVIGRARPGHFGEYGAFSFHPFAGDAGFAGFPSGHATTLGAVTAILVLLFPRARFAILPVGVWFAVTRIVVGSHYPSDVAAGFSFGFAFACCTAIVFARLGYVFRQRPAGLPVLKPSFFYRMRFGRGSASWPARRLSR